MEHWAQNFFEKITPKHVWILLGTISVIFGILRIFRLSSKFRSLEPAWNSRQIFFSKKSPQNTFKTRLDTFGNSFGHFWKIENFSIFLKFFEVSMEHWAKKVFWKIRPKTCSKHVWILLGMILGLFGILKIF